MFGASGNVNLIIFLNKKQELQLHEVKFLNKQKMESTSNQEMINKINKLEITCLKLFKENVFIFWYNLSDHG